MNHRGETKAAVQIPAPEPAVPTPGHLREVLAACLIASLAAPSFRRRHVVRVLQTARPGEAKHYLEWQAEASLIELERLGFVRHVQGHYGMKDAFGLGKVVWEAAREAVEGIDV